MRRREEGHVLRRMEDVWTCEEEGRRACPKKNGRCMDMPGKTWRGRQKTRWEESRHRDAESVGINVGDVMDRTKQKSI